MADPSTQVDPWDQASQQQDRRERWAATTPTERLHWLERAIRFAGAAGALPRQAPWPPDRQIPSSRATKVSPSHRQPWLGPLLEPKASSLSEFPV